MVGFRGPDWIYGVTVRGEQVASRAREFEHRIAAPILRAGKEPMDQAPPPSVRIRRPAPLGHTEITFPQEQPEILLPDQQATSRSCLS